MKYISFDFWPSHVLVLASQLQQYPCAQQPAPSGLRYQVWWSRRWKLRRPAPWGSRRPPPCEGAGGLCCGSAGCRIPWSIPRAGKGGDMFLLEMGVSRTWVDALSQITREFSRHRLECNCYKAKYVRKVRDWLQLKYLGIFRDSPPATALPPSHQGPAYISSLENAFGTVWPETAQGYSYSLRSPGALTWTALQTWSVVFIAFVVFPHNVSTREGDYNSPDYLENLLILAVKSGSLISFEI